MPDEEGYRLSDVNALLYWCEVIGQHSNADRLVPRRHLIIYIGNESLVQILNGLYLQFKVAVVTSLVAGLHMDKHKVIVLKRFDGSLGLAFIVGVCQTSGTLHLDNL